MTNLEGTIKQFYSESPCQISDHILVFLSATSEHLEYRASIEMLHISETPILTPNTYFKF